MKLVLMRHAEAVSVAGSDAERALTPRGLEQARETAQWLLQQFPPPAAGHASLQVFSSPYLRARQTGSIVAEVLRQPLLALSHVTPDDDARVALGAIEEAATAETVVVVTHMPLVATLSQWLEEGVLSAGRGFMLAEARVLEMAVPGPQAGTRLAQFAPGLGL